jgi:hypothetical protein
MWLGAEVAMFDVMDQRKALESQTKNGAKFRVFERLRV